MDGWLMLLLLAAPVAAALGVVGARSERWILALHIVGSVLTGVLSGLLIWRVSAGHPVQAAGGMLFADGVSAIGVLIAGGIGLLVGIYSASQMEHGRVAENGGVRSIRIYYALYHLVVATVLLTALANNIAILWVAVEGTTLSSALLVGFHGHKAAQEAAWKYVLMCSVGLAFALFGTVLTYSDALRVLGDAQKAMLWSEIVGLGSRLDAGLVRLGFVFSLIGFGTKMGLAPMHWWLPDAYGEAPAAVTALLSGVVAKAPLLGLVRYYAVARAAGDGGFAGAALLGFGVVSVCTAALFIVKQRDIKRKLAYSSMEHCGLMAAALGTGVPLGVFAALLHAVNHGVTKALLFCTVGDVERRYGTRDAGRVGDMLRIAPVTALLFGLGILSAIGVPGFNVFVSEFMTLTAGFQAGNGLAVVVIAAFLVVVFISFVRLLGETVFGPAGAQDAGMGQAGTVWTVLPLAVLAVVMVVLGLHLPGVLRGLLESAARSVLGIG